MKVRTVEAIPISVPGDAGLRRDGTDAFEHVLVRVETTAGTVGWGEIAPMPSWPQGLTQDACLGLVREVLAPTVEGSRLAAIDRVVADMEDALADVPFPIAGVDVALHDALGRHLGLPVADLLGGTTTPDGTISLQASIPPGSEQAVRSAARDAAAADVRDVKVKVGADALAADQTALETVVDALPGARIRVDANGAWSPAAAVPALRRLDDAAGGLVYVEQPVPPEDRRGLRRVREATGLPVVADEACFSPTDVAALAAADAVDAVSVKVAKAGGLARAHEAAVVGQAVGLAVVVGGMLELGIGTAASAHLAAAAPAIRFPTGIFAHGASTALLENDDRWSVSGPTFAVPEDPGLGIRVDPTAVERHRVD